MARDKVVWRIFIPVMWPWEHSPRYLNQRQDLPKLKEATVAMKRTQKGAFLGKLKTGGSAERAWHGYGVRMCCWRERREEARWRF